MRGAAFSPVPNRGMITISIMLANIMQGLDNTILNVALPHIQGSLSASLDQVAWALTSYIVCSAIMMPLPGWLAGRFGIKHIFLVSIIGFTVASALCGAATSLGELVAFRALQGVAGALLIPLSQATLLQINPPERHGHAMAVFGVGTICGPIMGPALGGWLTQEYSWRWVFYINLPIGLLCTLGVLIFIRHSRNIHRGARPLPVQRAHGNDRRTVVPQPRPVEEHQFHRRYGADVCRRADHDRDARTVVDDAAKPDGLSGDDDRRCDHATRPRCHGGDVRCGAADHPGRQPADHRLRFSVDRAVDVADEPVLTSDGDGTGHHFRAI